MTFSKKYNSLLRQCFLLPVCVFLYLLPATAQPDDCGASPLFFVLQPIAAVPKTICTNYPDDPSSVEFAVEMSVESGYSYQYQWQKESETTSGTWADLPGATSAKYSTSVQGNYRCYVRKIETSSGNCAGYAYSGTGILYLISIKTQPDPADIQRRCDNGGEVRFEVEMEPQMGDGFYYEYRWQVKNKVTGDWGWINPPEIGSSYGATAEGEYRCYIARRAQIAGTPLRWEGYSKHGVLEVDKAPSFGNVEGYEIFIPNICDGENLVASVVGDISQNGQSLENYEWKFSDNSSLPAGVQDWTGTVPANNKIPDLIIPDAKLSEIGSKRLVVTVTNKCGSTSTTPVTIINAIKPIPNKPTPVNRTYCTGETPVRLSIVEPNKATWFDMSDNKLSEAPMPVTDTSDDQKWLVSQELKYGYKNYNNDSVYFTCTSEKAVAEITVLELSPPPDISENEIDVCRNTRDVSVSAEGTNLKWYNNIDDKDPFSSVTQIQINTSDAKQWSYYVTQTLPGICESLKKDGEIKISVREVSTIENIDSLWYTPNSCPEKTSIITAIPRNNVREPVFQWYTTPDKSDAEGPFYEGASYETPVLTNDVSYYVSIQYKDNAGVKLCESINTKAAVIYVRDIELPRIIAPSSIPYIDTDEGKCYATVILESPIVSDNCTEIENLKIFLGADTTDEYLWDPSAIKELALGDTTLIWWAQDEAGNRDYDYQAITVRDREKPKGGCPANIIWEIDENEDSAIVTYKLDYTDNCSAVIDSLNLGLASGSTFKLGKTRIRHFLYDASGNMDTCEFYIEVKHPYIPMLVSMRVSNYELCPGEELVLTPIISGGSGRFTYSWNKRNWTEAVMRDYPLAATTYEVKVRDVTAQMDTTITVNIKVLPRETVSLTLEGVPMEQILEGDEVVVTATPTFQSYKLILNNKVIQIAGLNSIVSFEAELGEYGVQVFATDFNGCVAQDYMVIDVESKVLPNIFTPNFDGKNEIFLKGYLREGDLLEVYNRAGVRLYSGYEGWDGYYRGVLMPQETYMYTVRRRMNTGEMRIYKGTVTLKL